MQSLPKLNLPRRFENLERQASSANIDPLDIVERVDDAANRIDVLLDRVRTSGGLFEVIFGESGSGKTTFVRSLPKFYRNVKVEVFEEDRSLEELPGWIKNSYLPNDDRQRVVIIQGRDNPEPEDLTQGKAALRQLLNLFRKEAGQVVLLWTITDRTAADTIAEAAWEIGRDSMVDIEAKGIFQFSGLPKARWAELADRTSQSLSGDKLEAFGLNKTEVDDLLSNSSAISIFFAHVSQRANQIRDNTWSVLKQKVVPHVWVVLASDDPVSTYSTTVGLTQGARSRVDVELILEYLDAPEGSANYVRKWQERRERLAHYLRAIDLRIFDLPPNVSLAAVRKFGDATLKDNLRQKSAPMDQAKKAMRATRLYKAILDLTGKPTQTYLAPKKAKPDTADEYVRVQQTAANNDKPLNRSVAKLLEACLKEDGVQCEIIAEKMDLPETSLRPDIQIKTETGEYVCLELTWRSSGRKVDNSTSSGQDTSKAGHMKKYSLGKADDYIVGLGLDI